MLTLRVDPLGPDPAAIARAAEILRRGGIVAYPTDTLYGLAVDPFDDQAVERLFAAKDRPAFLAAPLIAGSVAQATQAGSFGVQERLLADAFWPGPLSLVVPAVAGLSRRVVSHDTVAIRVPAHAVARAFALAVGRCVTATSANISGERPAVTAADVTAGLAGRVDAVLDAGPTTGGPPSTIVQLTSSGPRLVRAGAIAWERVLESLE